MLALYIDTCAERISILAYTSNSLHAESDDSPYISITLNNGESQRRQFPDNPGDDMARNGGDLWIIPIDDFHFHSKYCIEKQDIGHVAITPGGNDGWKIKSIITKIQISGHYHLLTANLKVERWVDGNGPREERYFPLTIV